MSKPRPFKLIMIGDVGVGKSTLVQMAINNKLLENPESTIGAAFFSYKDPVTDRHFHLWDTAGSERYAGLLPVYLRDAQIVVIVYDITDKDSFANIGKKWIQNIEKECAKRSIITLIVGNKIDLENDRKVTNRNVVEFLFDHPDVNHVDCSGKTGQNVDQIFEIINSQLDKGSISALTRSASIIDIRRSISQDHEKAGCNCIIS